MQAATPLHIFHIDEMTLDEHPSKDTGKFPFALQGSKKLVFATDSASSVRTRFLTADVHDDLTAIQGSAWKAELRAFLAKEVQLPQVHTVSTEAGVPISLQRTILGHIAM